MTTARVVTACPFEPIDRADVKVHLRVGADITADDTLIDGYIAAARAWVTAESWRALMPTEYELTLDSFPAGREMELPYPPLQSVTWVKYTTAAGVLTTFDSANYVTDPYSAPGRLRLVANASWPTGDFRAAGAVAVRYIAGSVAALLVGASSAPDIAAARAAVPAPLKSALLLLVGHLYENREAVTVGAGVSGAVLPLGVSALIKMGGRAFRF